MDNFQNNQFGNNNNSNPTVSNYNDSNSYNNNLNNNNNQNWQNNNNWNNNNWNNSNNKNAWNNDNSPDGKSTRYLRVVFINSIFYIILLIIAFLSTLLYVIFETKAHSDAIVINSLDGPYIYYSEQGNEYLKVGAICAILSLTFAAATFISGIIAVVFTSRLSKTYKKEFDIVFLLSAIGIIVPFVTFIACCITISKHKRLSESPIPQDNGGYVNRNNPY